MIGYYGRVLSCENQIHIPNIPEFLIVIKEAEEISHYLFMM